MRQFRMRSLPQKISLALLTLAPACAQATWPRVAMATEVAAVGSLACDGGTTDQFLADAPGWAEGNPILGERPSDLRLWGYLGAITAGVVVANRKLDPRWATLLNAVVLGAEVKSVAFNMHVGASTCGVGDGGPWLPGAMPPAAFSTSGARPR